jgi:hypothetical protein
MAARLSDTLDEFRGNSWTEVRLARMNLANGLRDFRRRRSLEQITARPAPNRTEYVIVRIVGGEHDDTASLVGETRHPVEPGSVGQPEIK